MKHKLWNIVFIKQKVFFFVTYFKVEKVSGFKSHGLLREFKNQSRLKTECIKSTSKLTKILFGMVDINFTITL